MAEADGKTFRITTKRMEFEPRIPDNHGRAQIMSRHYLFTFAIESTGVYHDQIFEIPVWVSADSVDPNNVVRAARHQLLLDLEKLASSAQAFRIPENEIAGVYPEA